MKKTLSVLLSAVMLFCTLGVMPFSASADGAQKSGECGYGVNYRIDPDAGILNIMATDESTGVMYDYDNQESPFYFCNDYYIISVWEGVTSIGSYAFQANRYLDEVALPSTLTKINRNAFANCESMFMINFPTNLTTIGAYAFHNCYALEKIILNDNLKTVGDYAFYNCNACDTLKIGSSVTRIGTEAFRNCQKISEINIPATLTTVGSAAFDMCIGLKSVNITDLKAWCKIDFANDSSNPVSKSQSLKLKGGEIKNLVIPSGIKSV
ncbi:MAG: leucine-rich repeat domain-containing protein, partial [Eubacterium sp.]|nr:leucine-rich repeat domain-containing protein [Eubacterium sp.]